MIKIEKLSKDFNYERCTSCQAENSEKDIYEIKVGKSETNTMTVRLCEDCMAGLKRHIQRIAVGV